MEEVTALQQIADTFDISGLTNLIVTGGVAVIGLTFARKGISVVRSFIKRA